MTEKIKRDKKIKIMLMFVIVLFVFISFTYAFFGVNLGVGTGASISATTGETDSLTFYVGDAINIHASLENFYEGHENLHGETTATASLKANDTTNQATGKYNVFFIIDTNDFEYSTIDGQAEIIMKVTDPTGKEVENITGLKRVDGGFDITTRTGGFLIMPNYDIEATPTKTLESHDWKLEVTLVNLDADQNKNKGKSLNGRFYITTEELSTYELAKVNSIEAEASHNSITANMRITEGSEKVDKYYYAIEEDKNSLALLGMGNTLRLASGIKANLEYTESDDVQYTFNDLTESTSYVIYGYVKDKQGMISNVYQTTIVTEDYDLPKIENVEKSNITLNSMTLTINAKNGSNAIVKYYFSKDNGQTYVESDSNTYTFSGLLDTTEYKIKVKVEDSDGRFSTEYYEAISTTAYINPSVTNVVSSSTYHSITLDITAEGGTSSVAKYYYSINGGEYKELSGKHATIDGLNEKTEYNINIKAEDANGRRSNAYNLKVTTAAYLLVSVGKVSKNVTTDAIYLTVTASPGDSTIASYEYSNDGGETWHTSTNNTYSFTGLNDNQTYQIRVRVKDANGIYSEVYEEDIKTIAYVNPSVTKVDATSTYNSITLTVTATGGTNSVSQYYFSKDNGVTWTSGQTSNVYIFTDLTENETYNIKVKVSDTLNKESSEFSKSVTTNAYVLPIINSLTKSSTLNSISITVNTTKGTNNIVGYYYSSDDGATWSSMETSASHTFNELNDTTTYKIKVKVEDSEGRSSEYGENISTVTYVNPSITKVTSSKTYNSISLTTTAAKGTNNVANYYYKVGNGSWSAAQTTNTYTISDLNENTKYTIKVKVEDTAGRESSEFSLDVTTNAYNLPTISKVSASTTFTSITLTATAAAGDGAIQTYYYSKDNGSTWSSSTSNSFTFNGLNHGTIFYLKVKVEDANGRESEEYSKTVSTDTRYVSTYIKSLYTSQGANGLYYHSSSLGNSAGDNSYRYAGANPNNYICFGATVSPCPDDNLYRIIGVFGNQVKIMKADYANDMLLGRNGSFYDETTNTADYRGTLDKRYRYKWNTATSTNTWSESNLNTVNLNTNYLNNIGSTWASKIATISWQVAGNTIEKLQLSDAKTAYSYELGANKVSGTYNAKVGLIYVSDYYYAASPTYWTYKGSDTETTDYRAAVNDNWMYLGNYDGTITKVTDNATQFLGTSNSGAIALNTSVSTSLVSIRPTFNLVSTVTLKSGSGTKSSPYYIDGITTATSTINSVTSTSTYNSITATVSSTIGSGTMKEYYYSLDNGTNWTKVSSNVFTISGLTSGTSYSIKIKGVDANNKETNVYTLSASTPSTFATYIRNLYTSQGSNGIYYHSSSLANGAGDNSYRYAGADPNNYVCFGSTASTCPTDNLYRIIGIFDDRIKLIKFDYAQDALLGVDGDRKVGYAYNISSGSYANYKGSLTNPHSYYWNYSSENSSLNNWSDSRLNKTNLNTNFINRIGSSWSSKIATTTWYVGGATLANAITGSSNAKTAYNYEIGSNKSGTTYSARIGLPYVSEYYYAASSSYWTYPGYTSSSYLDKNGNYGETYDYRAARSSNWMDNGMNEWLISRTSDFTQSVYLLSSSSAFSWTYVYNDRSVRPTFTLDGNVLRASGSGTKSSPYRISVTQSSTAPSVTSLTSTSVTSSSVTLSANANAGANAISKFLFSRDGTNWYEATGYDFSRYTFSGLSSNTSYTFRVKAVDANGVESAVYTRTVTTSYVNPSVTSVSTSVGATSISVTANASAGSASLKYYYFSKDGGSTWTSVSSSSTSVTHTFSGLSSSTTYSLAVKVYDTNNYVSSVYYTSATTSSYVYPSVTNVVIGDVTSSGFTVTAYASGGTNSLQYYYFSTDGGSTWTSVYTSSTVYSYTFSGMASSTYHSIAVKVYDTAGYASSNYYSGVTTLASVTIADFITDLYAGQGYNDLYYHNRALSSSAQDYSFRYYGPNPNNYICFGTYSSYCPDDNLYRIIGVFDGVVKLMKYTPLDEYHWGGRASNTSNWWSESTLNTSILNSQFYYDFATRWQNMIYRYRWVEDVMYWNQDLVPYDFAAVELNPNQVVRAYIGLPYVSDYTYATDSRYWDYYVMEYNNSSVRRYNWMWTGYTYWTIMGCEDTEAYQIGSTGDVTENFVDAWAYVYPTFFLYSDIVYVSGLGTYGSPFRIDLPS